MPVLSNILSLMRNPRGLSKLEDTHAENTSSEQTNLYKLLFENAAEGLVLSDRYGTIVECNPRAYEMFGYPDGHLIGLTIEHLIPKSKRAGHSQHRENYNRNPVKRSMGIGMNLTALKKDGTEFPVEISLNSLNHGNEMMVVALITDISKRKEIEDRVSHLNENLEKTVERRTREMMKSQNLYFTIARNFPDGTISVFDQNLNYLFFEGKELYKAGLDSSSILGTSIKDRLPGDIKEVVIDHLLGVFDGKSGVIEFEAKGNYYEINAVPIVEIDDEINQILVVERNITVQKRAEKEVLNALGQERALNELKSRFVSMASHEFRTPLSTILSSISLIDRYNEGTNSEKVLKHITRIKSSVQNLNGILNDFLSLDKLEEGNVTSNPVLFNIRELVQDLLDEMEASVKPGQKLITSFDCEKFDVQCDAQILKNILINLTSNAIKYSEVDKDIEIAVMAKDKTLEISVTDHGIGIPDDEQKHLFERFFRARNVTNIEGTGLGLNIVKKYVDLLGGTMDYKSKLGLGTSFFVTLPLKN